MKYVQIPLETAKKIQKLLISNIPTIENKEDASNAIMHSADLAAAIRVAKVPPKKPGPKSREQLL